MTARSVHARALAGARALWRDLSVSAVVAGFIAVAVSYAGPMVVVLAAASAGGLSDAQTTSWVWAISIGSGTVSLVASAWTRTPIVAAWSTPGAALLTTALAEYGYPACVAAFVVSAVATLVVAATGWFGLVLEHVPAPVLSAVLAGILLSFGLDVFRSMRDDVLVPMLALAAYLVTKRFSARYAVIAASVAAVAAAVAAGQVHVPTGDWGAAHPMVTVPQPTVPAIVGLALPLFVVTMAAQNAPGLAVLRASGYRVDDRKVLGCTGFASLALAPFGAHAINLAAITAAICAGAQAHPDPRRRYIAGISCGVWYLVIGSAGAALLTMFSGLPEPLVLSVAGIALLGALLTGLTGAMECSRTREAALLALLVTASGVSLFGIGSAFWGLVLGVVADRALNRRDRSEDSDNSTAARPSR